jgi:hypothetical protein
LVEKANVVRLMFNREIIIVCGSFSLQCDEMECVKDVEGESSVRRFDRAGEKTCTQELNPGMRGACLGAATKTEVDGVNAICMSNVEIVFVISGRRTRVAVVAKVNDHADGLESCALKK